MKTIELSKEQIIDRSPVEVVYTDIKRCLSGGYSLFRDVIYWTNKGVRILTIVAVVDLTALGGITAFNAYQMHLGGKSLGVVIEGGGEADMAPNEAAVDAAISEDLALERKEASKWDRKTNTWRK